MLVEEYIKTNAAIKKRCKRIMAGKTDYKNKWQAENCERISLIVPKGKKDIIREYAASKGESINGFINRAIDEAMADEGEKE